MRNEGVDSVRGAVNSGGNDRYLQKCKPGISGSTLTDTNTFRRAFEMSFFAGALHLPAVRIF